MLRVRAGPGHQVTVEAEHLGLDVWRELRRNLDGVVAPWRVAVLHVSVTLAAHAGAGVLHVGTWVNTATVLLSDAATPVPSNKHVLSPCVSWWWDGPHHVC